MTKIPKPLKILFTVADEDTQDRLAMIFQFVERAVKAKTFASDERLNARVNRLSVEHAKITRELFMDQCFWSLDPEAWDWRVVFATGKCNWHMAFGLPGDAPARAEFELKLTNWLIAMGVSDVSIQGKRSSVKRKQMSVNFLVHDQDLSHRLQVFFECAGEAQNALTYASDVELNHWLDQSPAKQVQATRNMIADERFWGLHPEFGSGEPGWEITFTVEGDVRSHAEFRKKVFRWLTEMGASSVHVVDDGEALDEE